MADVITLVNTETEEQKTLYSADARALLANQQRDGGPQVWRVAVPGALTKPAGPSQDEVRAGQAAVQRGGSQEPRADAEEPQAPAADSPASAEGSEIDPLLG